VIAGRRPRGGYRTAGRAAGSTQLAVRASADRGDAGGRVVVARGIVCLVAGDRSAGCMDLVFAGILHGDDGDGRDAHAVRALARDMADIEERTGCRAAARAPLFGLYPNALRDSTGVILLRSWQD